ncbi:hypothetical protein HDK64DRAFT_303237 [Phyllosticta capitalensis]
MSFWTLPQKIASETADFEAFIRSLDGRNVVDILEKFSYDKPLLAGPRARGKGKDWRSQTYCFARDRIEDLEKQISVDSNDREVRKAEITTLRKIQILTRDGRAESCEEIEKIVTEIGKLQDSISKQQEQWVFQVEYISKIRQSHTQNMAKLESQPNLNISERDKVLHNIKVFSALFDSQMKELDIFWVDHCVALGWVENVENLLSRLKKRLSSRLDVDDQDAHTDKTFRQRAAIARLRLQLETNNSKIEQLEHEAKRYNKKRHIKEGRKFVDETEWAKSRLIENSEDLEKHIRKLEKRLSSYDTADDADTFVKDNRLQRDAQQVEKKLRREVSSKNEEVRLLQALANQRLESNNALEVEVKDLKKRLRDDQENNQVTILNNDTANEVEVLGERSCSDGMQERNGQASKDVPQSQYQPPCGNLREEDGISKFIVAAEKLEKGRIREIILGPMLKEMYKTFDLMKLFPRPATFQTYRARATKAVKARRTAVSEEAYIDVGAWTGVHTSRSAFEKKQAAKLAKLKEIEVLIQDGYNVAEGRRKTAVDRGHWARAEDQDACVIEDDEEYNDLKREEGDHQSDTPQDTIRAEGSRKNADKGKGRAMENSKDDQPHAGGHHSVDDTRTQIGLDKPGEADQPSLEKRKAGMKRNADGAQDADARGKRARLLDGSKDGAERVASDAFWDDLETYLIEDLGDKWLAKEMFGRFGKSWQARKA